MAIWKIVYVYVVAMNIKWKIDCQMCCYSLSIRLSVVAKNLLSLFQSFYKGLLRLTRTIKKNGTKKEKKKKWKWKFTRRWGGWLPFNKWCWIKGWWFGWVDFRIGKVKGAHCVTGVIQSICLSIYILMVGNISIIISSIKTEIPIAKPTLHSKWSVQIGIERGWQKSILLRIKLNAISC